MITLRDEAKACEFAAMRLMSAEHSVYVPYQLLMQAAQHWRYLGERAQAERCESQARLLLGRRNLA